MFEEYINQTGMKSGVQLKLDVSIRWNSIYLMLQSALKFRCAFNYMKMCNATYELCPLDEEWTRVGMISDLLLPFYTIITLFSSSCYSTSNLYFHQIWKIKSLLLKNKDSNNKVIRNIIHRMHGKFDK